MKTIHLQHVLPHVFARQADLESGVWNREVSFEKGKTYLVEADSGRGKSSLCGFLMGYRRDYSGVIRFDNDDISSFGVRRWCDIRQHRLAYLFQELRLFPELSAYENVEVKNALSGRKSRKEIADWFDRLGIADKMEAKVGRMSFGQQQRVALIRALVQPFDFLLLDEPTSHLDDRNAEAMARLLMEEVHGQGAGVIVTSIGKHMVLDYDQSLCL